MTRRPAIDFWFSIGSTYTYLTVMRLDDVARDAGIDVNWRPFSVRALMQEMNNVPFVGKPAKLAYMWRDLERRAAKYRIPGTFPVDYPLQDFARANRIAVLAAGEGWCPEYVKGSYELWFQQSISAGTMDSLTRVLPAAGQSVERVLDAADADANRSAYVAATDAARALGIFGSPNFVVGGSELFWGDDRLEDAVAELARRSR